MTTKLKQKQSPAAQNGVICIYMFLIFHSLPYTVAQTSNQPPQPYTVAEPPQPDTVAQTPPQPFVSYNFNTGPSPSVIIALIVIICAFTFLFFFSLCVHQFAQIRNEENVPSNGVEGGGRSRRPPRGLDPAVIETFPTFSYSYVKDHKLGKESLECAVCLNEFEDEDTIRLLPKCDHVFHPECIDAWLSKRKTCPVCRANLVPEPGETPEITIPVQDIESESDGEIPISEPGETENQQVSINVLEEPQVVVVAVAVSLEVISHTPTPNRLARLTKQRNAGRFPRSHSTGHSLVQPGEDVDRFTLRLPDDVRKQIMNMRLLKRTRSMEAFPIIGTPKKGNWTTGEGSSKGGKSMKVEMGEKPEGWVFSMTPPFFMRASSPRPPKSAPVTPRRP
ncbi:RING-H2 finger protein ATL34-like [Macadamia integrifolia]|uniref:RING-H2 finger protein ATL34-like n=1 Tax=Macadamia integrifolia TaxID=60698 RepID=UPI001C4EC1E1|nr:RING-H2 finger protein ATL34-like [Macadamia integrifolia]